MDSKYGINFPKEVIQSDIKRLVNQLWKLLPMKENNEDWEAHLNVVLEEVSGLAHIFINELDFLILLSKLEGLKSEYCKEFMLYRKTVFRCIELLAGLSNEQS